MKFSVFQVSRKGGRQLNEDRMGYSYTRATRACCVLADGMGGHPEGEVAAQLALQAMSALYQKQANPHRGRAGVPGRRRDGRAPPDHPLRHRKGHARHAAHDGGGGADRACRTARRPGCIAAIRACTCGAQRPADHPHARPLLPRAATQEPPHAPWPSGPSTATSCSPAWARLPSPCSTWLVPVPLQQGDKIMLCSDGLWGTLSDDEIVQQMGVGRRGDAVPDKWSRWRCARRRATSDNVTVIALEWETPDDVRVHPDDEDVHRRACNDGVPSPPRSSPGLEAWSKTTWTTPPSSAPSPKSTKPSGAPPPDGADRAVTPGWREAPHELRKMT
jgi:hypothetical protein